METVAIYGTGLIGASFGLALKRAGFRGRILGVSSAPAVQEALARGAVDEAAGFDEAARRADLVFLSQTIGRILETLGRLGPLLRPGALVTDAGSTKGRICARGRECLPRGSFLGGHPMAGKDARGAAVAEAGLFEGRTWILTPDDPAALETSAARELMGWVEKVGAVPVVMTPEEHDRVVAFTSHLPQLLSTALAATLAAHLEKPEHLLAAGPGLLDMTRLAGSAYEIWHDILETNPEAIGKALDAGMETLARLRSGLLAQEAGRTFEAGADLAARLRR